MYTQLQRKEKDDQQKIFKLRMNFVWKMIVKGEKRKRLTFAKFKGELFFIFFKGIKSL